MLIVKNIFILFFFTLCVFANLPLNTLNGGCENPKDFTQEQKEIILKAYQYGDAKNFGYTMAAIAWQESCAGKYLINFSDPSAGIYHAHLPGVIKEYSNLKDTSFNRNLVGQILIQDQEFASQVALEQLLLWEKRFGRDEQKIIKSYNKGTSWIKNPQSNQKAEKYLKSVQEKIELLRVFIPIFISEKNIRKPKKSLFFEDKIDTIQAKSSKNEFYLLSE